MIVLENIIKEFPMPTGALRVLHGISVEIQSGEYVSIMGPSGSGKSTLLNILGCLDTPTSGRYLLNARDTSGLSPDELADIRNHSLGFVFQRFHLIPRLNIVENVSLPLMFSGMPPERRRELATQALSRVGLAHRLEHKTNEISGGECQRVAVARAIVTGPKVLFADEPTGNLDSKSGQQVLEMIRELNDEGLTILLVTHDPQAAQEARRTITLVDGRVASDRLL